MLWYLLSRPFLFFQRKLIAILVSIVCSIARKFNFIPFRKIFNLATNLLLIITISLIAPFWMRRFFYSNFVEHEKPLEFVFNTCTIELSGVCSFPEAEFVLDPGELELQPNYYYTFTLDLVLFDTPQNRAISLIMAGIYMKDDSLQIIKGFHKSIPVFSAFSARSFIKRLYILTRNTVFWPLWLLGFFSEMEVTDIFTAKFPNYFLERAERPTRFITVQLQNRYIQLSSGSLRIRTSLSYWSFFINEYPLTSHIVLFCGFFLIFLSTTFVYYTIFSIVKTLKSRG